MMGTSDPTERSLSPEEGERHLLMLQTVCLRAEEDDIEGICYITAHPQEEVMLAVPDTVAMVVQRGHGVPVSGHEAVCDLCDLGLVQINILQEGKAESSENESMEEAHDMLLIEVNRDNDVTEFDNKVQQLAQSKEDEGKEAEGLSCKASDGLSDLHDEDKNHKCASPSLQAVVRNPKSLKSQMSATPQKKGEKAVFSCELCTYTSLKISSLNHHRKIHSKGRRHVCHISLKAFRTASLLQNHVNVHAGYAGKDAYKLKRHLTTHSGEKPHGCYICHTKFAQNGNMKAHMLRKHGENVPKYQRPHCSTYIAQKRDLGVHLQNVHSQMAAAIQCSHCEAAFHNHCALTQHKEIHRDGKSFKCEQCSPACKQHSQHFRNLTHGEEKSFTCSSCSKTFQQNQLFTIHSKKHCDSSVKCLNVGDMHKHPENCGLLRAKTATSSKRSRDRRKESENLRHAKQEGVSTVTSEHCAREIVPVLEGIEATALKQKAKPLCEMAVMD